MKNITDIFEKIVKKFGNSFTALRWVHTEHPELSCKPIDLIKSEQFDKIEKVLDTI